MIQRIKSPNPKITAELAQAVKDDEMCAMHAKIMTNRNDIKYLQKYLLWVGALLVSEKLEVFNHLLNTPVKTVEIVQGILDELKKIFEAQDRYIDYTFSSPEQKTKFEELLAKIGEVGYWNGKGFELMKCAPNSFVIVDLPSKQVGPIPEPYFYTIDPCDVIDTWPKLDGNLEFLIFKQGDFIYGFDDNSFKKFKQTTSDDNEYLLVSEVFHNLGYCPANTFWGTALNVDSKIQKQNVIIKSIGWLDSLLLSITMGEHLGLYAAFPPMIGYEHKCTYVDEQSNPCDGYGIIRWQDQLGISYTKGCPNCARARSQMYGPGSFHTAPAPSTSSDPNMMDGLKFVDPSTEGLTWLDEKVDSRIGWITYNLIGVPDELTREAINEKQVVTQFESRVNVLNETGDNFQRIHKWTLDTLARLQAGPAFKGSTVKYGTDYFLYSAAQIQDKYENAKKSGAAMYELAAYRRSIIQAKYKNNPRLKQRLLIMSWLEPYPDMLVVDMTLLGIPSNLIKLKAGLDYYVSRFEREYTDVVSFMEFTPLKTKMDYITNQLLAYVEEDMALAGTPPPNPNPQPNPQPVK